MRKLLFLLMAVVLAIGQLRAQQKTITGKVTDENGTAVPNVSVLVKGTTIGTVTRNDGSYSLSVSANAKTLVISSVGKETQEISISGKTTIDASLKGAEGSMQEVVVVGYGTQRKGEVTAAVSKVSGDKVANVPFTTLSPLTLDTAAVTSPFR